MLYNLCSLFKLNLWEILMVCGVYLNQHVRVFAVACAPIWKDRCICQWQLTQLSSSFIFFIEYHVCRECYHWQRTFAHVTANASSMG
jgi:hypothetical protein